jgi:MFS family permease
METIAPAKKQALLTPLLLLFMFAMILANLGGNMYGPLESLYLKELGATVGQIGLFFTLASLAPLVLQILGGWMSDSLGRLKAIAIGSVFGTIAQVILVLSTSWGWVLLSSAVGAIGAKFRCLHRGKLVGRQPGQSFWSDPNLVWGGFRAGSAPGRLAGAEL